MQSKPKTLTLLTAAIAGLTIAFIATPAKAQISVVTPFNSFSTRANFIAASFNPNGCSKLVVVATGEHNFSGNTGGQFTGMTFNGVAMTRAVDRNPVDSSNITAADIWYLDNPGSTAGAFAVTVGGNGTNYAFTVIRMNGTAGGHGGTAISASNSKSVSLTTTAANSLVLASHAMGGGSSLADSQNVNAVLPAVEVAAFNQTSSFAGHCISTTNPVTTAGSATYAFTGGATNGCVTIAAEFKIETTPPTLVSISDDKIGGPVEANTLVTYAVTFSEDMDAVTVTAADFGNAGSSTFAIGTVTETAPGVFSVPVVPTSAGTLRLQVISGAEVKDLVGNLMTTTPVNDDTTLTVNPDTTAPTLVSTNIVDDKGGASVLPSALVTYTVTFSEDMDASTVDAADFGNAGTSTLSIGTVTETAPGVFSVPVTPTSTGSLQLQLISGADVKDSAGISLVTTPVVDNSTLAVVGPIAYWDTDGIIAGAGGSGAPVGTWNTASTLWNTTADGTGSTNAWAAGQSAVFAAGTDASGIYSVTLAGTNDITGLSFEEGTVTLTGGTALRLVADSPVDVATGLTATVATPFTQDASARSLSKTGDGILTLGATNSTYAGNTTISAGTLRMPANRIPSSPTIFIGNGATLEGTAGITLAANQSITGTGATGFVSPVVGTGLLTTSGTTISSSGTLTITRFDVRGTGNQITSGNILSGGAGTGQRGLLVGNASTAVLTINTGASLTTSGTVAANADILGNNVTTGDGTLIINGGSYLATGGLGQLNLGNNSTNGGNGTLTLSSGIATIKTLAYQTATSGTKSSAIVNLDGGTLTLSNITVTSGLTKQFNFNGGQFVAGANLPPFSGLTMNVKDGGAKIDTNGYSFTISDPLLRFAGATTDSLIKSGLGTLTLAGNNTYGGGSSVTGGALRFSTAIVGSATNVTVAGGAEAGALVAANDAQWINTGDLTLQNSGAALIDYGSTTPSTTVAPISVTNFAIGTTPGVRLAGGTLSALSVGQTYPLVTWTGTTGPADGSAFVLLTHRLTGTFSVSVPLKTLYLTVTSNAANSIISWNTGNQAWDTSTSNWLDSNLAPTTYFDTLDPVLFGDATGASGNPIVTLATPVSPLGVTMNSVLHDYTISGLGSIGGSGALTMPGSNTRTLTLATANNTFSGGTTINSGTLVLGDATNTLPDTGAVALDGALAILSLGANSDTVGAVSLKNSASITGSGALTGTSYAVESGSISPILGGTGGLTKTTAGTVTLTGNNTYTGTTIVSDGTLILAGANTSTGATSVSVGTIVLANTAALQSTSGITFGVGTTLQVATDAALTTLPTFNGSSGATAITYVSDRATPGAGLIHALGTPNLGNNTFTFVSGTNVTSGTAGISLAGVGMTAGAAGTTVLNPTTANLTITGLVSISANSAAKTLALSGVSTGNEISGIIANGLNTVSVAKSGTSTWTLSGANSYTGTTNIDQGTLAFTTIDQSLTGGLTFGEANGSTNSGTLDLSNASATFAGVALVRTNSATANAVSIGATKTLTLNGGLTLGYDAAGGSGATDSKLTATGAGTMVVNGTTINISVNQAATNALYSSRGTLDVSGLAAFSTDVTSFNLGVGSTTTGVGNVLLSNTANTILATTLQVGNTGGNNGNGASTLTLGTGTNAIRADLIEIGKGKSSSPGVVKFISQTTGSPGTVTIDNKAGTAAANITVANVSGVGTGGGAIGTLDLSGHSATVNAGTLIISQANNNSASVSGTTGTVSFDAGTFTVATLNMSPKTGSSTGTANATLNVGGGTFTVNTAFTLGSQATAGASVATLNHTGGTFTSNVAITQGGGTTTSTINLDGTPATTILDLTGKAIGTLANPIILNAKQGTLKNVTSINGTGGLAKTTAGTLVMEGTISYVGDTTVSEGTLTLSSAPDPLNANTANDASTFTIASTGATLNLTYTGNDKVDKLFIGASQKAAGVYGHTNSGATNGGLGVGAMDAYFGPGTGTLTVASGTNYGSWILGFFPGETNLLIIGAGADPDNDGIENAVEMVIGGNPATGMDAALLPTLELVNADPDGDTSFADYLLFSYRRTDLSAAAGVTANCETDTDLVGPWTTATGAPGVVIQVDDNYGSFNPPAANTDRVRVYVPRGANTTLFGRLNVLVP